MLPTRRIVMVALLAVVLSTSIGCYSIRNGWLDPTVLGNFDESATLDIRTSLTLEDSPPGIPGAVLPTPEDMMYAVRDYPFSPGDTLAIVILELIDRQVPYEAQVQVSSSGYINIPIVGRVQAVGLTPPQLQERLVERVQELNVLLDPEVTVSPLFQQKATYSIFGVGVSAANNAPLRAGTFPIRRPDLKLLEAINQVGGLNEFVQDIYVFRYDDMGLLPGGMPTAGDEARQHVDESAEADMDADVETATHVSAETPASDKKALMDAVLAEEQPQAESTTEEAEPADEWLEPEPAGSYIWVNGVNGGFVRNPEQATPAPAMAPAALPPVDGAAPRVDWARLSGEARYRIIRVSAESLRSGSPEQNICIRAGDVIRIVSGQIGAYYVMGQVNRVGPYNFNAEDITLKAAIAAAGGLSGLAWPDRCTVYRRLGQREQVIQVNLDRIFAGKDPDFLIKRGDIINVGTHPLAPFLQRVRAMSLPNPVSNVGYSFTYARNYADVDSYSVRQNPANQQKLLPLLFP